MKNKDVWEMTSDDIVVFEVEVSPKNRYKLHQDIKVFRPGMGKILVRELISIDNPLITQRFIRGMNVKVINDDK